MQQEIIGQFGGKAMARLTLCGQQFKFGDFIPPEVLDKVPLRNRRALYQIGTILLFQEPQTIMPQSTDASKPQPSTPSPAMTLSSDQIKPLNQLKAGKRRPGRPSLKEHR